METIAAARDHWQDANRNWSSYKSWRNTKQALMQRKQWLQNIDKKRVALCFKWKWANRLNEKRITETV